VPYASIPELSKIIVSFVDNHNQTFLLLLKQRHASQMGRVHDDDAIQGYIRRGYDTNLAPAIL
jgi:hypothetical protein